MERWLGRRASPVKRDAAAFTGGVVRPLSVSSGSGRLADPGIGLEVHDLGSTGGGGYWHPERPV